MERGSDGAQYVEGELFREGVGCVERVCGVIERVGGKEGGVWRGRLG